MPSCLGSGRMKIFSRYIHVSTSSFSYSNYWNIFRVIRIKIGLNDGSRWREVVACWTTGCMFTYILKGMKSMNFASRAANTNIESYKKSSLALRKMVRSPAKIDWCSCSSLNYTSSVMWTQLRCLWWKVQGSSWNMQEVLSTINFFWAEVLSNCWLNST